MSAAIAALTPAQLAMTPAGTPPLGVTPNFSNPDTRGPVMIIVGSIMVAFMLMMATLRYYTKICVIGRTTWDDCGFEKASVDLLANFAIDTCGIAIVRYFGCADFSNG